MSEFYTVESISGDSWFQSFSMPNVGGILGLGLDPTGKSSFWNNSTISEFDFWVHLRPTKTDWAFQSFELDGDESFAVAGKIPQITKSGQLAQLTSKSDSEWQFEVSNFTFDENDHSIHNLIQHSNTVIF
jgi:hypothetical protein